MEAKLDKWDYRMIRACKQADRPEPLDFVNIWAERCGIHPDDVRYDTVIYHLLDIVQNHTDRSLSDFATEVIKNEYPECLGMKVSSKSRDAVELIEAFAVNSLRLASVDKFPGYAEWREAEQSDV